MADYPAIAAVGLSLERLLRYWFEIEDPVPVLGSTTRVVLISTDDLLTANFDTRIGRPALSIFLHRIEVNRVMRAAWSGVGSQTGRATLPVDLHFLLTAWGENAEYEQRILGRAMQCLEAHPTLSGPLLHESGGWSPHENVQVTVDDIPTEAVMRTFDSLPVDYRLTVPYVARLTRIETPEPLAEPVTTARIGATASVAP
jgi:hypothetical protein